MSYFLLMLFLFLSFSQKTADYKNNTIKSIKETSYQAVEVNGVIKKGKKQRDSTSYEQDFLKKFNKKGLLITEIEYPSKKLEFAKHKYIYDNNDRLIEMKTYASDDQLYSKEIYRYDTSEVITKCIIYDGTNKISEIWDYTYNRNKKLIKSTCHFLDINSKLKWTYKYDSIGRKIQEKTYSMTKGKVFIIEETTYTKNDYICNRFIIQSDTIKNKCIYKYQDDLITEAYKYTYDDKLISQKSYQYEFDKNNNWVQKIVFFNKKPIYIIDRIIEYY